MIEKAYEFLEKEKNKIIKEINELENPSIDIFLEKEFREDLIGRISQEKLKEAAIKEVDVHYMSIKNYLDYLKKKNDYDINDDLTKIDELRKESYIRMTYRINKHLQKMKKIPNKLMMGEYNPISYSAMIKLDDLIIKNETAELIK